MGKDNTPEIKELKRQLKVEKALERVRTRTNKMHKSNELAEVASLLFKQLNTFGADLWNCGFNIWDKGNTASTAWMSYDGAIQPPLKIIHTKDPFSKRVRKAYQNGEPFYIERLEGIKLKKHLDFVLSIPGNLKIFESFVTKGASSPESWVFHAYFFKHGYVTYISLEPCPELWNIFERFAKVFEQTYTRFLDLQKAEAQAREAQIEVALERVRARALAMHHSDELPKLPMSSGSSWQN